MTSLTPGSGETRASPISYSAQVPQVVSGRASEAMGEGWCWLFTGIAFCLRFYRLGFHSLWLDEVVTVRDATHSFKEIPSILVSYPPLWAYLTRAVYLKFGYSDFWLRVPAAVFGTLT